MSAEEALKYGLIDEIVLPNDDKIKNLMTLPPAHSKMFGQITDGEEDYEFGKIVSYAFVVFCCTVNLRVLILRPETLSRLIYLQNVPKPRPTPGSRGSGRV